MSDPTIKRPAFGRRAYLGSLYDARNEAFIDKNAFDKAMNPDYLAIEEKNSVIFELNPVKNLADRLKALKLEGEPMLSVLSELIEVSGSMGYVAEPIPSDTSLSYNIVERVVRVQERIKWDERSLWEHLSKRALEDESVTHIVVGIEWGSNVVVSFNFDNLGELDLVDADAKIMEKLRNFLGCFESKDYGNVEADFGDRLTLRVYNDINLPMFPVGSTPKTISAAVMSLKEANQLAEDGKWGVPVSYEFLDVRHLVKKYKIPLEIETSYRELSKRQLERLCSTLIESKQQFGRLNKFEALTTQALSGLSPAKFVEYLRYYEDCLLNKKKLEQATKENLVFARNGDEDARDEIAELPSMEYNKWFSPKGVEAFEKRFGSTIRAIKFYNDMGGFDIKFVKTAEEYAHFKRQFTDRFLILFYTLEQIEDKARWQMTVELFKQLAHTRHNANLYLAVNIDEFPDIQANEGIPPGMKISFGEKGIYHLYDVIAHCEMMKKTNFVALKLGAPIECSDRPPLELIRANIPCSRAECRLESREGKTWICMICHKELEYDLGHKFYCECGASDVTNYGFRCSSNSHGADYIPYAEDKLRRELDNLQAYERVNILVIGKTGVGKSTWINATATYISHSTLEEAAATDFTYLIPFQFTTTNVTAVGTEVIEIKIGESKNEVYEEKMSVTQFPKAHYFKNSDQKRVYCIVDTPGVGDCRGIKKDKENMQNIVNTMGKLGKINLICFLMDPNEARLDPVFEFCFKELIMQFHRSAINNIAFCFTKASGCGYKVSETIVPLQTLVKEIKRKQGIEIFLNDKSLFVFDNIAYRYLAYLHQKGIPEKDQTLLDLYARSYEVSAKETMKMLNQALHTPPHRVEDTLHLNYSRRIIKQLAPPLTMIGTKVNQTINELKAVESDAISYRGRESEMLKILKKKVKFYRFKMTFETWTYCKKCAEYTEYTGAERDKFIEADPSLAKEDPVVMLTGGNCKEVNGKWVCKKCGPDFTPILTSKCFSKVYEDREEIDEDVQIKLNQAKDDFEKCQILIKKKKQQKEELELEVKEIQQASAKFGIFLRDNSITAYNDVTELYLLQLMDIEEKNGGHGGEKYRNLARMLDEYKAEILILEQNMGKASELGKMTITSEEVMKTAEELKKLKHYGKDIYHALEGVKQWVASGGDQEPPSVHNPARQRKVPGWKNLFKFF